jgi:hypothetical protein
VIKRAYLANGTLAQSISSTSADVAVDSVLGALLLGLLSVGDWCYLTVQNKVDTEVIRVRNTALGLEVDRAQDGTSGKNFTAGTVVSYKLTKAEITDSISVVTYGIYGDGYGIVEVDSVNGTNTVNIPYPQIETIGGVTASITSDNVVYLEDVKDAVGCCQTGGAGATLIGGPYFYLTSKPYPQEVLESLTPTPLDGNSSSVPPLTPGKGWWTLTQPSAYEVLGNGIQISNMNLFGSQGSISAIEQYLNPTIQLGNMNLFGGQKSISANSEQYLATNSYLLVMNLFGGAVAYSLAEQYLYPTIQLSNLELI